MTIRYKLGGRSKQRLKGVHEDLIAIVERAITITDVDFTVLEGVRSVSRQAVLFSRGATTTMHSRHITGHAVDLGAYVLNEVRWDWPLYYKIADAMKKAAKDIDVVIEWGGDWKSFKDGPHFQLPWDTYPPKDDDDDPGPSAKSFMLDMIKNATPIHGVQLPNAARTVL